MELKNTNTEQAILEAAEMEFVEKGYARAKTTEIAKRAGVNHAMLHYYFRTKENLFNMIFKRKTKIISDSLMSIFDQDLPFFERIKFAVETHFDFVVKNFKIISFVYSGIIIHEERDRLLKESLTDRVSILQDKLKKIIDAEVEKGTIHPIEPIELVLNIISLNIITFLAMPILDILNNEHIIPLENVLQERKKNITDFIIRGLKV